MNSTSTQVIQKLEAYKIKSVGTNRYRFNSPFRAGADGMTCSLLIHDDEHGAWFEHKEDSGGGLYDLAKRLGINTPHNAPTKHLDSLRAYNSLDDYAHVHGVDRSVFESAKWHETTRGRRSALAIPTRNGTRFRFLDGDKPKFINPTGFKACWYGLNTSLMQRIVNGQPFVITNGEPSTVVGQHYGMAVATIAGGGEKPIPSDLLDELKEWLGDCKPEFIIAMDCDSKGMKAAQQLVRQLQSAGFRASAVDLNLWDKGDLADFCKLHGEDSPEALRSLPRLTSGQIEQKQIDYRGWRILSRQTLLDLPPIEWLIPRVVPKNALGVIYGAAGTGKSFYALDMAATLAGKHSILYMIGEGELGYGQRLLAWEQHHHRTTENLMYCGGAVKLLDANDYDAFLAELEILKPDVLFVDTMRRSMVGHDENSARDVGLFVERCDQIKRRFGCTVVIIHHTNKGGVSESGSGALRAAADFMIKLEDDDGLISVENAKSKDAQPFERQFMRLLPKLITLHSKSVETAVIVEAEKIIQTADDPLTPAQQRVLEAMGMPIFEDGITPGDLSDFLPDITRRTVMSTLSRFKQLGFIEQPAKRAPYSLTEAGLCRLSSLCNVKSSEMDKHLEVSEKPISQPSQPSQPSLYGVQDDLLAFAESEFGAESVLLPGMPDENNGTKNQYDEGL